MGAGAGDPVADPVSCPGTPEHFSCQYNGIFATGSGRYLQAPVVLPASAWPTFHEHRDRPGDAGTVLSGSARLFLSVLGGSCMN